MLHAKTLLLGLLLAAGLPALAPNAQAHFCQGGDGGDACTGGDCPHDDRNHFHWGEDRICYAVDRFRGEITFP